EPTSSRGLNGVVAAIVSGLLSEVPHPQPPLLVEILALAPDVRAGLPDSSVPRSLGGEKRSWEVWEVPDLLFGHSPTEPPRDGDRPEVVLPSPQLFSVVPFLRPLDLTGLELGMQQFLKQLEQIRPGLPQDGAGAGPCLWIVAGAAVLVACEIARRHLRSDTKEPALEVGSWPGSPADPRIEG